VSIDINDEFARMLGEAVVAYFKKLSRQFTRGADENLPNMKYVLIIGLCSGPLFMLLTVE
jgi:hypothetical protein